MKTINIQSVKTVIPMIYAYSTPEIKRHDGWTKIGYTEQDVNIRLKQQMHTADIRWKVEWQGTAIYDDGSGLVFRDTDFHSYLVKRGTERKRDTEWFHISGNDSKNEFIDFKENRGICKAVGTAISYKLRKEQESAVSQTADYFKTGTGATYLWNAKPRFGKTLSVYDLCKKMKFRSVLIVTNRPAIANSWYSDYVTYMGEESGYLFVSNSEALKNKTYVLSRQAYLDCLDKGGDKEEGCIEFISLQDLKGSIYFGGEYDKLEEVAKMKWDILVVDEAHEGVDTLKTDLAFEQIKRNYTLHLSGTPFKALANEKFPQEAIFNWTYADEQKAKLNWPIDNEQENPYLDLPQLNMYTYQMSEIVKDELEQGIEIQGKTKEYAFDLNEFFEVVNDKFVHDSSVDKFLDALTKQKRFPFSTDDLRNELKHTLWILNRVESAKLLAKKLREHPVFREYNIVLAAGDGRLSETDELKKSYEKVKEAINSSDKTITLSVGQLTTGVTVPEWTAVLMLSNIQSPALYMQAAFRAQNPCLFNDGNGKFLRKENAYIFDFDPARTLIIYESFANDLSSDTTNGHGDTNIRKNHVKTLLNFFPVIGEDVNGEMIELDAEKVLSIPRKIKAVEVVKRGFMSDYLFQNISNVFHAPQAVVDIISNFDPVSEHNTRTNISPDTEKELFLDENGNVNLDNEYIIGKASDVFGNKIYGEDIYSITNNVVESKDPNAAEKLKSAIKEKVIAEIVENAQNAYGFKMKLTDKNQIERILHVQTENLIDKSFGNHNIDVKKIEKERDTILNIAEDSDEKDEINQLYDTRQEEQQKKWQEKLKNEIDYFFDEAKKKTVEIVEINKIEREKKEHESIIRDHLRGFARTIPSFLMAYGEKNITLKNFDTIIPNDVFREVTGITLKQFRFLRDGGPYINADTGKEEIFKGELFDPIVFDDSVKEFMKKKRLLANYFDEDAKEDIFDYIPSQKTNQKFTPKVMVKKMIDMLELENPKCFDDPNKKFMDLYMKSGLYITEIVKRLYQNRQMKQLYPDNNERLQHIFEKQVYGLAPTEIIYKIATNYILGFADTNKIKTNNLKKIDTLPYVKKGTLEKEINKVFGDD